MVPNVGEAQLERITAVWLPVCDNALHKSIAVVLVKSAQSGVPVCNLALQVRTIRDG